MDKINNKDWDKLTLYVKRDKVEEIILYYQAFAWELVSQRDNKKYEDIVDLMFIRAHKIKNKDELQLQQVHLEENLNSLGKLEKYKHAKSSGLGLFLGGLALAGISLGILGIVNVINIVLWLSITMTALGGIIGIVEMIVIPTIYRKEKEIFAKESEKFRNKLDIIKAKALKLLRGE